MQAFPDSDTHRIGGSGSGDMRSPTGPPHAGVAASVVPPPAKAQSPEGAKPTQFGHGVVKQVCHFICKLSPADTTGAHAAKVRLQILLL